MRTCQQCDKIYLRSAAGQVKAHFVGISGIRTRCARPSNWIYAGSGKTFSDSESDASSAWGSVAQKNETKRKKLKSKSKCKPDYHKNGRRAASLTRGHILNVNRRRYHCPYILLPRPPPAQPRMQRCCCCLLQRCVVRAHQKFNKIPLNYKMKTIHFSWPQFLKFSYRSSTGAGLYLYLCFSGFIIIMQQQQKKLQRFVSLKQQHLMSLCSYKQ